MSVFYFNRMPVTGPWGGGNKTLTSLVRRLVDMGHTVTGTLRSDIDVIFCVDPRVSQDGITYSILRDYATSRKIPLIQRVGDVGSHGKPDLTEIVRWSTQRSDRVIFTSKWARDVIEFKLPCTIIANGSIRDFFDARKKNRSLDGIPRIVTHHWSNNPLKGISMYERLARQIQTGDLAFDFTYIGRSSSELSSCTVAPLTGDDLSKELSRGDIYLSASLWEAGANHIVEAMACGLPVIYSLDGGSIPEYCQGRGAGFRSYDEMVHCLNQVVGRYAEYCTQSESYERTIDAVIDEYLEVLCTQ